MTDNEDYEEVLDGTVDEAKSRIKELENPDFERLLDLETEGKNRKTLRNFIENRLEEQERQKGAEEERQRILSETVSPRSALGGGLVVGALIGVLLGGFLLSGSVQQGSPGEIEQSIEQYVQQSGVNGTVDVSQAGAEHGLYRFNVTIDPVQANASTSSTQVYTTRNGELMIPIRTNPLTGQMVSPIPLEQRLSQQQAQ